MKSTLYTKKHLVLLLTLPLLMACGNGSKNTGKDNKQPLQNSIKIDNALRSRLADFAQKPRPKGNFGFHVYDLTADKPVYGYNENEAQSSASCMKLLSGVAGLHLLGTKYLYATSIYTQGHMVKDTLVGNVTLKAGLDPQLDGPDLKMFAEALRRKGIKHVKGNVYLDLLLHEPVKSEPHWYPWDLSFSRYGIFYKGADRVKREFKAVLRNQGIAVTDAQLVMAQLPKGSHCIFRFYRSINRVTERMWKNSSNTQATSMLYTIGHKVSPKGNYTAAGVAYLKKFMREELGLQDTTLVIHDGCGLCTYNYLSPRALTTVLRYGYQHKPIYRLLRSQLAIAGVDGTMRREMANPKTRGKIRAKTGTLSHPYGISSLAGYCEGSNGHLLAFAIMDTDMSVLDARVLQRKLCEAMVEKPKDGKVKR